KLEGDYRLWLRGTHFRLDSSKHTSAAYHADYSTISDGDTELRLDHVAKSYGYASDRGFPPPPGWKPPKPEGPPVHEEAQWAFRRPFGREATDGKYTVSGQTIKRTWRHPQLPVQWCLWRLDRKSV